MFMPQIDMTDLDDEPGGPTRVRRTRSLRLFGLLVVAGMLAFGLWRSDVFGKWGERGGSKAATTPTTFYLDGTATIADATEVRGNKWYLIVQPTTDKRLCYQLADKEARVGFSCTGSGIAPVAPDSPIIASVVIPPLATTQPMPVVIMGATNPKVARMEFRVGDAVQRVTPVAWPELGRNGFIAPLDESLARGFPQQLLYSIAYDAEGSCIGALRIAPTGEVKVINDKACPK